MRRAAWAVVALAFLVTAGYASDSISQFKFQTLDGKTVEYKAGSGPAMVVNIGAHW